MKEKQTEAPRFVIYSRKSKFTGKGESIENQIEMCRKHIANTYGEVEAERALVYEDEGFSGGTLDRPQFKKMMEDSKTIPFRGIVVYRLDRISRNVSDFSTLITDLDNREIGFISVNERFDTGTPLGRAMMYICSVFAQMERETIAERIRDNMHELAKTGRWLGGNTPTGYASESISNVDIDGKTRKACKLKPVQEELSLVNLIFEKFLETGSLTKTDTFLLQGKYLTKTGKPFSRFAIKGILMNPVYMIADADAYAYLTENNVNLYSEEKEFDGKYGMMVYNRTLQQPGKVHKIRPTEEWIAAVGKHPGLIPGRKWVQVQKMLELNKSKAYSKPRSHTALLSGLLICGNCGDFMRPKMSDRETPDGERIYTYLCNTKERSKSKNCDMKNPNGNTLDALVIQKVKSLTENGDGLPSMLERSRKRFRENRNSFETELKTVEKHIAETDKEIKALLGTLPKAAGTVSERYIMEEINRLGEAMDGLKRRRDELTVALQEQSFADIDFELSCQMLSDFRSSIDVYNIDQKRAALRTFVRRVVWDGKNAHIYLFGNEGDCEYPDCKDADHDRSNDEPLCEDSK